MLVKEIIFSILDLAKTSASDDSYINEDHVLFLVKKYRSFLIKKEQEKERSSQDVASEFEYQQICLDLEKVPAIDGEPCTGGYYLRTTQKIPKILEGTQPKVYPLDYFQGIHISYINRDRMRFVGTNPYLKNIIYVALDPTQHLVLKSSNSQFFYLEGENKLRMSAIFEDFDAAADLLCDQEGNNTYCDPYDMEFPIRDYLVPTLIELVVKALVNSIAIKPDEQNNAKDNVPDLNRKA